MKNKLKVIFMGTPDFACPTLTKLLEEPDFEIIAVYTKEPQIAGRGQKIRNSSIYDLAIQHQIKVLTPPTLKNLDVQAEFIAFKADIAVVVAYGLILPKPILDGARLGCINLHPSLLPRWRGAAPIQRTIMSGDEVTAIDIIQMNEGLDGGDILHEERIHLNQTEDYPYLANLFAGRGAELICKTIKNLAANKISPIKQDDALVTYANKIEKTECEINWRKDAIEISRQIRALNGFLGAFFKYDQEKIKILEAEIVLQKDITLSQTNQDVGKILDNNFTIQCFKNAIRPKLLQREGKKPTALKDFLLGFKPEIGKIL